MADARGGEILDQLVQQLVRTGVVRTREEAKTYLEANWNAIAHRDWSVVHENPGIASLYRYFLWADRMYEHFKQVLAPGAMLDPVVADMTAMLHPYMSYFYGAMFAVIEGWRELGLHDTEIDELLTSPNVGLLRRHRNGAFHFQKDYFDSRFVEFISAEDSVDWIRKLRREFGRYLFALGKQGTPSDAP